MKKTKFTIATIALVLVLTTSMLMATTPIAEAQFPFKTYTYISVSPNPVGIYQNVSILFWLHAAPPQTSFTEYYGWNFSVTITSPDRSVFTAGPFESDSTGGSFYVFTPDMVGTYECQANFLGATIDIARSGMMMQLPRGVYDFLESSSSIVYLEVQEEQVEIWSEVPFPEDYWTRPVTSEFRTWYIIAGNWLGAPFGGTYINKYTTAPNTAHMVWTKELTFGGLTGGEAGYGINYYTGLLYENKFSPYIINGRLYYNMFATGFGATSPRGVVCVDLRTGEEVWRNEDMPQISTAQILQFNSGVQTGSLAYLWASSGSNWLMYDAYTGRLFTTIEGASGSLSPTFGPNGELLSYSLSGGRNTLSMWNSTLCLKLGTFQFSAETYQPWTTPTVDWSDGIQYTVSIPDVPGTQTTAVTDVENGVLVAESVLSTFGITPTFVHVGYNLTTGQEIWRHNWTDIEWGSGGTSAPGLIGYWGKGSGEGYYMFFEKETMQWHVVDIKTGVEHFATNPLNQYTKTDWSVYDWTVHAVYGKLFISGYSGCVVAFDLETGDHLWTFDQGPSGLQTPFGRWPLFGSLGFADNKVFFPVTEHTPTTPIHRGFRLYALDADLGDLIWEMPAFFSSLAFADGYLVGYSGYDNQIYCFGKGPTETTVTIQNDVISLGGSALIKGTVMDISSGVAQDVVAKRFPNGLPAMSDDSMTEWMKHVYLQWPTFSNVTGVPVKLAYQLPDGSWKDIDQVISDEYGNFGFKWTPPGEGTYVVKAFFLGSESYWGSSSTTYLTVGPAAEETPCAEEIADTTVARLPGYPAIPEIPAYLTIDLIILVIVLVVLIIGLIAYMALRKQK